MSCIEYSDTDIQNTYSEGFKLKDKVINLFVWNFFGEIIRAGLKYPGSWHDSKPTASSGLYYPLLMEKLLQDTPH